MKLTHVSSHCRKAIGTSAILLNLAYPVCMAMSRPTSFPLVKYLPKLRGLKSRQGGPGRPVDGLACAGTSNDNATWKTPMYHHDSAPPICSCFLSHRCSAVIELLPPYVYSEESCSGS
ncbi:hypothetical protein Nepgr_013392 [Nepenthes gracilis]|uniref:Uncharacterized protein n=1 Tax=Nepenthes gracilis TaxID=150966 RepID=A0AAD3XPA1_NEPGR|nr:hypothetical protein Nepgr_013392 [Nepenthes gracilis]